MDAMIVVDMQAGLLDGAPKHDLAGVIARINALTRDAAPAGREGSSGSGYCGRPGDGIEPVDARREFRPALIR